jgi:hypothetical protein
MRIIRNTHQTNILVTGGRGWAPNPIHLTARAKFALSINEQENKHYALLENQGLENLTRSCGKNHNINLDSCTRAIFISSLLSLLGVVFFITYVFVANWFMYDISQQMVTTVSAA